MATVVPSPIPAATPEPPSVEAAVEPRVAVDVQEIRQATEVLTDAFKAIGGAIVTSGRRFVEIGAPVPESAAEVISEGSLAVSLSAFRAEGAEAGTIVAAENVPDFEIGNVSVQTVGGEKVATVSLSDAVTIQGEPKLIVSEGGALTLAIAEPTLSAEVQVTEVVDAVGNITEIGVSISAPIDGDLFGEGASFRAEVVLDPSALDDLVGFTLLANENPLAGITVTTDIKTTGPATLTLTLNAEAYQAMLDAGQVPLIRRITDDGDVQTFEPTVEVRGGTAFFNFESPGFSSFILLARGAPPTTAAPTATAAPLAPTATATSIPIPQVEQVEEDGGGLPRLIVLAIALPVGLLVIGIFAFIIIPTRRRRNGG